MTTASSAAHDALTRRLRAAGCVYAEDEAALLLDAAASDPLVLRRLVERRVTGEPLEYVLGWVEFDGMRLRVAPGVFVPRTRTVAVVREASLRASVGATVLDLCCGVGAIGAALLRRVGPLQLVAADIDADAVAVAQENLGDRGIAVQSDVFDALPNRFRQQVDVIAVNAPYVPTSAIPLMPSEARGYEQHRALDGGPDGLALHARIAAECRDWLRPGGVLVIETSADQAAASARHFAAAGLEARVAFHEDLDGTVVVATAGS